MGAGKSKSKKKEAVVQAKTTAPTRALVASTAPLDTSKSTNTATIDASATKPPPVVPVAAAAPSQSDPPKVRPFLCVFSHCTFVFL